jgi:hypothetical protein
MVANWTRCAGQQPAPQRSRPAAAVPPLGLRTRLHPLGLSICTARRSSGRASSADRMFGTPEYLQTSHAAAFVCCLHDKRETLKRKTATEVEVRGRRGAPVTGAAFGSVASAIITYQYSLQLQWLRGTSRVRARCTSQRRLHQNCTGDRRFWACGVSNGGSWHTACIARLTSDICAVVERVFQRQQRCPAFS